MERILLIICVFCLIFSCSDDEKAVLDLSVSPSVLEFDNTKSTKKVFISSNTQWASSCEQEWCTASIIQKFGNDTVNIQVSENNGDERIAYISFSNPEKTLIKTVKVIQKAKDENLAGKLHSGLVNHAAYFLRPSRVGFFDKKFHEERNIKVYGYGL
ncbi:MAG: BACON domain-containing protein [Prevotellaceae bacterium]|jgi:hypothetical protein|nr:BACON domain-containing protein [Prevotellaceae bacterium]